MLGKSMKQYVLSKEKTGYSKEVQNVYNSRLRNYAVEALNDLALLAEKLPEDQQAQIFSRKNMAPLMRNVFRAKVREDQEEKEEFEKRCQRILYLSWDTLSEIGFMDNAWCLAPDVLRILLKAGLNESFGIFVGLKAIYIKGCYEPSAKVKK